MEDNSFLVSILSRYYRNEKGKIGPKISSGDPRKDAAAEPSMSGQTMKRILLITALCLLVAISVRAEETTERPSSWAHPIAVDGVPNLHQVSTNLYRSAQPTSQGIYNLKKMGIKTIVNLRSFHSDRDEIGKIDIGYEHIYMKAWHPEQKEVIRFLQIVTNPNRVPVLVHCQHGADRTGTMCAIYRIVVQDWTKEEAIREMTEGGFGFHEIWFNLPDWINELNVLSIKAEAGVKTNTEPGN